MKARVPLLDIDAVMSPESHEILEGMLKSGAPSIPPLYAAVANSDNAFAIMNFGIRTISQNGFDPVLRELVMITVAQETRTVVAWSTHVAAAERVGAEPRLLQMIGTKEIEDEPAPIGAALRYARLLARNEDVADSLVEELRANLGDKGLVDLTMIVAFTGLIDHLFDGLGIPLNEGQQPVPFVTDP